MTRWFVEELHPHEAALRNWLRAHFPSIEDSDDLVQESYLRVWRARATGPINNPKGFLFTVARNLALNLIRHRNHEVNVGEMDYSAVLDDDASVPEKVARRQEVQLLKQVLQTLPERCREVFMLRRFFDVPQREIAARLGISEKTVEAQSFKAMKKCTEFFRELEKSENVEANAPTQFQPEVAMSSSTAHAS